jgi:hypothetical protein
VSNSSTYRPAHGAVALAGDGVALSQVLAGTEVSAVGPMLPRGTRLVTSTPQYRGLPLPVLRIRDPIWVKIKIRIRDEHPGSYVRELRNNFLG